MLGIEHGLPEHMATEADGCASFLYIHRLDDREIQAYLSARLNKMPDTEPISTRFCMGRCRFCAQFLRFTSKIVQYHGLLGPHRESPQQCTARREEIASLSNGSPSSPEGLEPLG